MYETLKITDQPSVAVAPLGAAAAPSLGIVDRALRIMIHVCRATHSRPNLPETSRATRGTIISRINQVDMFHYYFRKRSIPFSVLACCSLVQIICTMLFPTVLGAGFDTVVSDQWFTLASDLNALTDDVLEHLPSIHMHERLAVFDNE